MKLIPLTQGYVTKVDDEDYEWLTEWKWYAGTRAGEKNKKVRVVRSINFSNKIVQVQMPREIMRARSHEIVDHINGDTMDNQKNNLRLCSLYQNSLNRGLNRNNKTGYKCVTFRPSKKTNQYASYIRLNKKLVHLGFFDTAEKAARAYNEAAKKNFGEFAKLNVIPG